MIWPTQHTFWYLLLGLLPLVYLIRITLRYGKGELFSLRVMVIVIIWVGYQLSPWIAFYQGDYWNSFLLAPAYLDTAIFFSALSMLAILVGYGLIFQKRHVLYRRLQEDVWVVPRIHWHWVFFTVIIFLAIAIYTKGGLADFWDAAYFRGEGQWRELTLQVRFENALNVLLAPLAILLTLLSALYILYRPSQFSRWFIGLLGILTAMLPAMHGFSRMAGFPLLLFAYLIFRFRKFKITSFISIALLMAGAFFMGNIGYNHRGFYTPGVGNFLHAVFVGDTPASLNRADTLLDPGRNTLDAAAPFTRQAEVKDLVDRNSGINQLPNFLLHINPLPSGIINPGRIGVGLAEYMGTVGSTGITTPALADIFKAFGYVGVVVLVLIGGICGYFDRYALNHKGMVAQINILLIVIGTGVSLHSGIRAWTRPMLYAAVLIAMVHMFSKRSSPSAAFTWASRR